MSDALQYFSPATKAWFEGAFGAPTRVQDEAWHAIRSGRHALIVAPTGSGKTLAAFLWALDQLANEPTAQPEVFTPELSAALAAEEREAAEAEQGPRRTRVLYLSPLKALGVDVERNLQGPLVGITQTARRLGQTLARPRVAVRSGDTTPAERRRQRADPPDILITTPESLYLMLTSEARTTLTGVETVILDEVHAVAGSKRGAHLALSLERLDALLERPAQRIGLSATVRPLEEVARFLGGGQPVEIVNPPSEKRFDLLVRVPVDDMSDVGMLRSASRDAAASDPFDDPFTGNAATSLRDPSEAPSDGSLWPHIEAAILERILEHRSTIVFANSRRLAERLTARLNELWEEQLEAESGAAVREASAPKRPPAEQIAQSGQSHGATAVIARAHHGSVSKEARAEVEEALKTGALRCVVATSSLELGIDMGDVELVIQLESPPSIASGLQRLGRAGHQVGVVSRGDLFPKHRADVLHSAVAAHEMVAGRIESLAIVENPLDVLAQQTVAAAAIDTLEVEAWFDLVRRAAPFSKLPRSVFDATLDLIAGRYPSDAFAELRPRIVWDRDEGTLTGRPGAQRLAVTSGGTIPDRGMFGVFLAQGASDDETRGTLRVGELDEEMVYESRVGDVFALGATSWRIVEITHDRVNVTPAFGEPGRLPFWTGDTLGRPAELGEAIGRTTREIVHALPPDGTPLPSEAPLAGLAALMDERARNNLVAYLREQRAATGHVPSDRTLLVERFRDELGDWRLVLHSPYGKPVHAPWALIVSARITERFGVDGSAVASDDGIIVRLPDMESEPPGAELFVLDPEEIEPVVAREVGGSALFASRFREAAARALLLPRLHPGKRSPLWQQRQKASQLLDVARGFPQFPIILETIREVLHDVYDLPALVELARRVERREVHVVETETASPSPFARTLLFGYVGAFMYEGDAPLAERRAQALAIDTGMLAELLGRVELRELLDERVIWQVEDELQWLVPERRARDAEAVADLLRVVGPLPLEQLAQRIVGPEPDADGEGAASAAHAAAAGAAPNRSDNDVDPAPGAARREQASRAEALAEHAARGRRLLAAAQQLARELIEARRTVEVRFNGITYLAAIEDAGRLRDALGAFIPPGIPNAFLEPLDDPIGDLIARYARTHGPFTIDEIAEAFALAPAVAREALARLTLARRLTEGAFRPGAQGREWVDANVLRRIRARSLAVLRNELEPVEQHSFARFLPSWQHVGGPLRSLDGLVTVIDQLAGSPVPASALERFILPSRLPDYTPALLDELLASGEVRWRGHGSIPGGDGWVSLHLSDTAALTLPPEASEAPSAEGALLLELFHARGALFANELLTALNEGADGGITPERLTELMWELVWQGHLSNDTFHPLRHLVAGTGGAASRAAHRAPRRAARGRLYRGRAASTFTAGLGAGVPAPAATPPQLGGRWFTVQHGTPDPNERALAQADLLLDRYGVITKGSVMAEGLDGGFALAYRVLSQLEERGKARRGYIIHGLGAAQFSTVGAIDRLRQFELDPGAPRPRTALTLAACDPANPYGAALAWPDRDTRHRPGRKAGGLVTLVDGELILYAERGGKTLLTFTNDDDLLSAAVLSLGETLTRARVPGFVIEKVDGAYVHEHPITTWLAQAGFQRSPRGFTAPEVR